MALDVFLGATHESVATKNDVNKNTVANRIAAYRDKRDAMLRMYYTAGDDEAGRKAVAEQFGVPPEPKASPTIDSAELERMIDVKVDARVAEVEKRFAASLKAIEDAMIAKIDDALTKPEPEKDSEDTSDDYERYPTGDLRRENYRVHVAHQATDQWRQLFGANGVASDGDLRRRLIGVYFQGKLEGSGQKWTCTGINRYTIDPVRLHIVVDHDCVHIVRVEKLELKDI